MNKWGKEKLLLGAHKEKEQRNGSTSDNLCLFMACICSVSLDIYFSVGVAL